VMEWNWILWDLLGGSRSGAKEFGIYSGAEGALARANRGGNRSCCNLFRIERKQNAFPKLARCSQPWSECLESFQDLVFKKNSKVKKVAEKFSAEDAKKEVTYGICVGI
jgi:hypothetical protein